jgi:hypothetical protein
MKIVTRREFLKMENVFFTKLKDSEEKISDYSNKEVLFKLESVNNNDFYYINFFDLSGEAVCNGIFNLGQECIIESAICRDGLFEDKDDTWYLVTKPEESFSLIDNLFNYIDFDKYSEYKKIKDF